MQIPSIAALVALRCVAAAMEPAGPRLDLPTLLERAASHASVAVARASAGQAHARADEVRHLWLPRIELTTLGGPTPTIHCSPSAAQCTSTDPEVLRPGFAGTFWRVEAKVEMPVYTFGKLDAGKLASEAAARASDALVEQTQHDVVVDAARAYFAVKLGRELMNMLDEGREHVQDEVAREAKLLAQDSGEVTEADHRRLLALGAEIDVRYSEAQRVAEAGLAGVHYLAAAEDADVDAAPLAPLAFELPTRHAARTAAAARPERRAAAAGVEAARGLTELEQARWWPDFVLVGAGALARSSSVEHPHNAFLNDPFNTTSGGLGLVLRWAPDVGVRMAKIAQATQELARAAATLEMATDGMPADAERAWSEARDARDRLAAAQKGERHTQAWLASLLQAQAAGLVEPRDLADALLQSFLMRGRAMQATFDWNVGVMAFQRATGQLPRAGSFVEEE